jgi:peptide/nickel transport system substrate-binding protein
MNALVYLGINGGRAALSDPTVRRALGLLTDRTTLSTTAYSGWALPATLPVHPHWGMVKGVDGLFGGQDLAAAQELLETTGHKKLKLEMIYSTDSQNRGTLVDMVRTQLESAGIQVTAVPLSYADYLARLQNGQYDLYIGEIRLTANMDLSPLFGGSAGYGIATDGATAQAYAKYRAGEITLQEFFAAFGEDMPYVPLVWRCGFAGHDRRMQTVTPNGYYPYFDFADWH